MGFFKVLTIIGAMVGFVIVIMSLGAPGAAQQAAGAAIAMFLVVAPYCIHGVLFRSHATDEGVRIPPAADDPEARYRG